jgi:hypothetical protein
LRRAKAALLYLAHVGENGDSIVWARRGGHAFQQLLGAGGDESDGILRQFKHGYIIIAHWNRHLIHLHIF